MKLLITPFIFPFMQKAIITSLVIGAVCAILSCFLILKNWSLMGDAISHAVLPGIIIAFIIGIPLTIGAFLSGIFCALATGYLQENSRIKEDTIMGIVFSGMFAFGLVLLTCVSTDQHFTHILFGNILGITTSEFQQILWISIITIIIILLKYKDFLLYCFDPNQEKVIGLPVKFLHYGLLSLLSLTIVASLQVVGIVLVINMLISPGIIAFILCKDFNRMLIVAVISSIIASLIGTIVSFYIDAATGPCIVLAQAIFVIFALVYSYISKRKHYFYLKKS
ncbi:Manganese transport system membrane protein MntB [Candidatus Arsenophonus lipoptenae]|uniref:Manganese transport system membrane protein MntB n=1 Tax=Candidatus Arsenophonus lipoptenae TaxID=634113 RepID=A0A120HPU8_9GAMM|nr:metal ABC transporter permease [Candidatus Arsenophonus lipoptenae]AMA64830.1 Manganese transport system membrane protein MntB [Candidatus Arsenophonus lipoptenae]